MQTSESFLQDNARPHVAACTMDTIHKLKWNVLPHPPYSPELVPSDYHLFGPLKEHLGGKRFHNNEEVIQDVQEWLHRQPKYFFLSGIHKFPDRGASVSQTREIMLKSIVSVSENKSVFLFYLRIIIHICPTLVSIEYCTEF